MNLRSNAIVSRAARRARHVLVAGLSLAAMITTGANASEGGASVYPAGVETILRGRMPGPGASMFLGFNNFYASNSTVASRGETLVPGFHPRVSAVAFKLAHNWGVKLFGGALVSSLAVPVVDIHFSAPFGTQHKIGVSNPAPETLVAYKIGSLHWWYGVEVFTPGFSSKKTDLVNIGQHNYAAAPSAAFSYLPNHGTTERSSEFQHIVNYRNDATQYRSGDELVWDYAAMRNVSRA